MDEVSGSAASTADGSRRAFTTKENGMLARLQLSTAHAKWLEAKRHIPCELAADLGVVSKGEHLAFECRHNGAVSFLKVRRAMLSESRRCAILRVSAAN